jgi:hypothetical protein
LGGRISQHGCDIPGTETTFTALSNQIASVDPLLKELSALYEGNSTQPETDKCKIFIECKTFLNSGIVSKKAEFVEPNAGGPQGKRVASSAASSKKQRTHGTTHVGNERV